MLLYDLIVRPLELLIEVIFTLMYRFFQSPGIALFGVSIAVSFLVLPLYIRADAIQEEEQKKQKEMQPWLKHIRNNFRGDERYMLSNAYYKEMDYHPLYAMRNVLSLTFQIPFFMAAYHFLSGLQLLQGCGLGLIKDLGSPDGMLVIGGLCINILPLMMTGINCLSGAIYSRGYPLKTKLQIYILALVFLVLLYNSPSGLVIYWTMNNIFSLCKNIVMKHVANKKRFLALLLYGASAIFLLLTIVMDKWSAAVQSRDWELVAFYVCIVSVTIVSATLLLTGPAFKKIPPIEWLAAKISPKKRSGITAADYYLLAACLTVMQGMIIPLSVVYSSPQEFVNVFYYKNPLFFVLTTAVIYAGLYLVWGGVIYHMLEGGKKELFGGAILCLLSSSLLNYYCFHADVGTMGIYLNFDRLPHYPSVVRYVSFVGMAIMMLIVFCLWMHQKNLCRYAVGVVLGVLVLISSVQAIRTEKEVAGIKKNESLEKENVGFNLSRDGRNVVVIMLDAAISGYIPFFIEEKPEIKEMYDGFVYYPNAVSSGIFTNYGAQEIYGGYEYTVSAMNERSDLKMSEKYDEAFKLMPELFGENGYNVTVSDISYAGYQIFPDFSIYDGYLYVNAFHYGDRMCAEGNIEDRWRKMERNFVFYSVYRCVPPILQDNVYDKASYLSGIGKTTWYPEELESEYMAMTSLPEYTRIMEGNTGEFIMYCNYTAHSESMLQLPDYTMPDVVNNDSYLFEDVRVKDGVEMNLLHSKENGDEYYFVNMAAILRLGEWFDYLKENGVWDNTRIIVVSDHGRGIGQFDNMKMTDELDVEAVNCLLMVKDYDSTGFSVDESFMTNADVPSIAMQGIIDGPVNPFTGKPVDMSGKEDGMDVFWGVDWSLSEGNVFEEDASWYHVRDNIFDADNWMKME